MCGGGKHNDDKGRTGRRRITGTISRRNEKGGGGKAYSYVAHHNHSTTSHFTPRMDHGLLIDHIDHIDHLDHINPVSAVMRCAGYVEATDQTLGFFFWIMQIVRLPPGDMS